MTVRTTYTNSTLANPTPKLAYPRTEPQTVAPRSRSQGRSAGERKEFVKARSTSQSARQAAQALTGSAGGKQSADGAEVALVLEEQRAHRALRPAAGHTEAREDQGPMLARMGANAARQPKKRTEAARRNRLKEESGEARTSS